MKNHAEALARTAILLTYARTSPEEHAAEVADIDDDARTQLAEELNAIAVAIHPMGRSPEAPVAAPPPAAPTTPTPAVEAPTFEPEHAGPTVAEPLHADTALGTPPGVTSP